MSDVRDDVPLWYRDIFPGGKYTGFYEALEHHALVYVRRSADILVVTFDNLAEAGGRHLRRDPWAGKFVAEAGWSHLGVFANGPTWFRDPHLIARLEQLRDVGFFESFSKVVFAGTSMGGFGALAFARLSPGATVISFSPQSSLSRDLVPWEKRFAKGRGQDWTLPYSDAADGLDQAGSILVVYDPFERRDKRHVDRLISDKVVHLRAPGCGHKTALVLRRMGQLKPVMACAVAGTLDRSIFARMIRRRHVIYLYKEAMVQHLKDRGHPEKAVQFVDMFRRHRRREKAA